MFTKINIEKISLKAYHIDTNKEVSKETYNTIILGFHKGHYFFDKHENFILSNFDKTPSVLYRVESQSGTYSTHQTFAIKE